MSYNPYFEAAKLLSTTNESELNFYNEISSIETILEDVDSSITKKYHEKLFTAIMNKAHIDFGDIPKSKGNIRNYSGYETMDDTLNTINQLAIQYKAPNVQLYVKTVQDAIQNIVNLSSTFERGFDTKTEYVALEYDTYVFFCVEATTALVYSFVEVIKSPDMKVLDIRIRNTKLRADEFYFEQLRKFNNSQLNMGADYRKMLEGMCDKGRNNFTGAMALGIGAVVAAALAVIPITREAIYQIYNFRGKIAEQLSIQAHFLELNKSCLEANNAISIERRISIMQRQEKLAKTLKNMADKLRVKSAQSILDAQRELKKENGMLSIDNIKDDISNSPFELL